MLKNTYEFREAMVWLRDMDLRTFSRVFYDDNIDNPRMGRSYLEGKFKVYSENPVKAVLDLDNDNLRRVFGVFSRMGAEVDLILCSMCGQAANVATAHLHQGKCIGECCWDERLRMTE